MPGSPVAISLSYRAAGKVRISFANLWAESSPAASIQPYILVIERRVVDADLGRRDPARDLARRGDPLHQARDKRAVFGRGQPLVLAPVPFLLGERVALRVGRDARPDADRAVEAGARQPEAEIMSVFREKPVPALHADIAIADIGAARHLVHSTAHRHVLGRHATLPVGCLDA